MSSVFEPATLPCGRVIENRLVKVALYEHLAKFSGGPPNEYHFRLYSRWARHAWGMVITGNVQVTKTHLSLGRDVVIPEAISEETLQPFRMWSACIHTPRSALDHVQQHPCSLDDSTAVSTWPLAIMQLSHSGRQSPNFLGGRLPFVPPMAPSPVAVGSGVKRGGMLASLIYRLLFQTPKPMSVGDIDEVVLAFVRGARVASEAGFDGVQLHAAHGCEWATFARAVHVSKSETNKRGDEYSVKGDNALRLIRRIVLAIREAVPKTFVLGIKLNASDYVDNVARDDRALDYVRDISSWDCVDFIEISGGDYENPEFMQRSQAASPRQALFETFSHQATRALESSDRLWHQSRPLVLLTGGLRSSAQFNTALLSGHADLLGVGRAAIICPDLPQVLARRLSRGGCDGSDTQPIAVEPHLKIRGGRGHVARLIGMRSRLWVWAWPRIPLVGAGVDTAWYTVAMRRYAATNANISTSGISFTDNDHIRDRRDDASAVVLDEDMSGIGAVLRMWVFFVRREDPSVEWKSWVVTSGLVAAVFAILVCFSGVRCG